MDIVVHCGSMRVLLSEVELCALQKRISERQVMDDYDLKLIDGILSYVYRQMTTEGSDNDEVQG